jgi:PAS domain S-box-containing protein
MMDGTKIINVSGQLSRAILDAIGEGVSVIDKDMKIVWVNPVIEKWAGPLEDIKEKNCYKVYQKRDTPCENCPAVKTFKTGKIERSRQYAYDTVGNIRYFEFISAPMPDEEGRNTAVVELAVDVTEKAGLEHKLKEAKNRLQTIFDNINDGISVIDRNYQILRVNRGVLKMFNKEDFSNLIGRHCFREYHKNEAICENCPAEKTFEDGNVHSMIKICRGINNPGMVLDISTFPIKDDNGKVIHVIEHIKNVSETVKFEDRLFYQERLAGIGELASGIAHEIRNPLGNIVASTQFCLSKYDIHELARKHLRIVLKNAENANRIIKDLLDFARPREISFQLARINEVIDSACNLVKTRCLKKRVRLTKRLSRRLPEILLDEKRLEEVFLNFILNALDAMPDGGRMVITSYPDSQNNEIVVTFSDTGEGIPPENLDKILNPFFTTKENGIGLGLCLAQQVITYHKGKLYIESKSGYGTEIIVKLPILRETGQKDKDIKSGNNLNS